MYGITVLCAYALIMIGATMCLQANASSCNQLQANASSRLHGEKLSAFLVGNKNLGVISSAMSIAATWIWAPALFVSAEKAYTQGLVGLFWFVVPNVACLLLFAPFARTMRNEDLGSMTLAEYMGKRYKSQSVKTTYLILLCGLSLLSTAVQLLAGGQILANLTGLSFIAMTTALSMIALSYAVMAGIRASVMTDMIQMGFILMACMVFVPWAISIAGTEAVANGIAGQSGEYTSLISASGLEVFFGFGLPSAIGLLAGPFGDQCFWQRAYAIRRDKVQKAFTLGAFIFAIAPISMGILGLVAAGSGFVPDDTSIVNVELVTALFPQWATIPFLFMLISGLLSTVDSNLCAISALSQDLPNVSALKEDQRLIISKKAMVALLLVANMVATVQGLTVTQLFLFYGTMRATTFLTTVATLKGEQLEADMVCKGIKAGLFIGLPIFAVGNLNNIAVLKTVGSLTAVLLPYIVAKHGTKAKGQNREVYDYE